MLDKLNSFVSNKSAVTVMAIFWARILCSLAAEDACFRMRITLGVVLVRSVVSHVCVPERFRNESVSVGSEKTHLV